MKRSAAALLVLAALAAPAAAAPEPIAVFFANLASNPKAAAASLADCKLLLAPNGEARTPCTLALADLAGAQAGAKLAVKNIKYGDVKQSVLSYVEADVQVTAGGKAVATYHVIALDGGNPDAGFAPPAMHVAKMVSDKDAAAKAKAKQLAAAPAIGERWDRAPKGLGDDDTSDRNNGFDSLENWLKGGFSRDELAELADDDGVIYGSAPGQKYTGKAAAKQIKKWKLDLAQAGGVAGDGGAMIVFGATKITGTLPDKTVVPYVALVVEVVRFEQGSGDHLWSPKLISFAVPQ